jgi:hypothetical protein
LPYGIPRTKSVQWSQEDYAHITAPGVGITGSWNDLTNTGILPEIINPKDTLLNMAECQEILF